MDKMNHAQITKLFLIKETMEKRNKKKRQE